MSGEPPLTQLAGSRKLGLPTVAAHLNPHGSRPHPINCRCIIDPADCSVEVLTMGKLMANTNAGVSS